MPADDSTKKHKLTVFLMKYGYADPKEFLTFDEFNIVNVDADGQHIGQLIYKGGFESTPSWVGIFSGVPGFDAKSIRNRSSKALFVMKHEGRWFCFTFGYESLRVPSRERDASSIGLFELLGFDVKVTSGSRPAPSHCPS